METTVSGIICLDVDDLFCVRDQTFYQRAISLIQEEFHIGSEDTNEVLFVGHQVCWKTEGSNSFFQVDQERCIEELGVIEFDKSPFQTQSTAQPLCIRNAGVSSAK